MATKTTKGKVAAKVAAGLIAAAAAGYYFYGSKQAKQHRKIVAKWATDMKKEVVREAKRLKELNAKDFAKIVDTAARTYRGVQSIDAADLKRAASELKSNWELVRGEVKRTGRKDVARAKVVGKKALANTKKTVKKVAKKVAATARKSR